ncbi:YceI family protein [Lutibacter sp. B1]|uniref:YceI family protein n=1 Tax=Lutibacter sp. B1 TaxID=2725996 RepID=UPI00145698C7|nr:YceI family protein [Lutibacter sp. B1]NLP58850.1 YceI family protein [Lutibacter sp. B1]
MKKLIALLFLVNIAFVSCKTDKPKQQEAEVEADKTEVTMASLEDGKYTVNPESSLLNWKGFKPTGAHNGTVAIKEGSFTIQEGSLTSGSFAFDMSTITVLDIPADDEFNGKLVGHLKSGDFFDVENFETSTFEITEVEKVGEGYKVKGNLTVKDITKPIEFAASVSSEEGVVVLKGDSFKIDRTEFDIKYKSAKFFDNLKDKFINDEFEISFEVKASK